MRALSSPPRVIVDPATRLPSLGSFQGYLPGVDLRSLDASALFALAHEKRWVYGTIAAGELFLGFLVIHLGYAANHFVFAFDRASGQMLVDRSSLTLPFLCNVAPLAGEACSASYAQPLEQTEARLSRRQGSPDFTIELRAPGIQVAARLASSWTPPIGAVVRFGGPTDGLVHVTQKHALLSVSGDAVIDGRRFSLEGGFGGIDHSHGYVPRRAAWKWAFAQGRARGGERVGLNLVEGFVGEPECAVWIDDELHPVGEGRISFDEARPLDAWQVRSADGAVDLRFEPGAMHAEHRDLLLVSSSYVQPVGSFSGSIEIPGRGKIEVERVLGVVEDQHVLW
jgi:hypothetical protein